MYKLANDVTDGLEGMTVPLRVAVMGCVVNGPGEAREADLGVASGNGKGQIFVKGEVIKTVPESEIVATLIAEANRIAEEMGADAPVGARGRHALSARDPALTHGSRRAYPNRYLRRMSRGVPPRYILAMTRTAALSRPVCSSRH